MSREIPRTAGEGTGEFREIDQLTAAMGEQIPSDLMAKLEADETLYWRL